MTLNNKANRLYRQLSSTIPNLITVGVVDTPDPKLIVYARKGHAYTGIPDIFEGVKVEVSLIGRVTPAGD